MWRTSMKEQGDEDEDVLGTGYYDFLRSFHERGRTAYDATSRAG
jgi:hypothetical protein